MKTYTVFVCSDSGEGTIHIASYEARDVEDAKDQALSQVCADWEQPEEARAALHVLGVAAGDVEILEWEDVL